ncbi:MAG TPA: ATPase, T2SS/T4P/T4SS family [Stenomitos sp.]
MAISGNRMRLGEILIKAGILTEEQLNHGLAKQQHTRAPIGEILIQLGYVTEAQIKHALELQYGVKSFEFKSRVPTELTRLIPESMIKQHKILPVSISQMTVAMVDPGNILALDDLRLRFKGVSIQPVVITEAEFREVVKSLPHETSGQATEESGEPGATVEEQSATQLAMAILGAALRRKATEIILEPQEAETTVRLRIDGMLVKEPSVTTRVAAGLIARFKVMAELALTAGNVPQTGTLKLHHEGRAINVFLRSLPVRHGQLMTLRLFDHGAVEGNTLDSLVLHPTSAAGIRKMLDAPSGLILINGPKNSGKSTLFHAILKEALKGQRSILSFGQLHYDLEGVSQVPVDPQRPETTLTQILDQAPDLLAMPSLTDSTLARPLVQGALAGNGAVVGMPTGQRFLHQLQDLSELPARTVAHAVAGVITVRLVRKLCEKCKVSYQPDEQTAAYFRTLNDSGMLYRAVGCPDCQQTGYSGQVGLYGVLPFDAQIRSMVSTNSPQAQIEAYGKQKGYLPLYDYATWVAAQGLSTLDELSRSDCFDRVVEDPA